METHFELILGVLTFLAVFAVGAAALIARTVKRQAIQVRLREFGGGDADLVERRENRASLGAMASFTRLFSPTKPSETLKAQLARAGFHDPSSATVYLGSKMLLLMCGALIALVATLPFEMLLALRILIIAFGAAALSFIPNLVVGIQRERRRTEIQSHLPDAVDLLEICVSAGMGLDMAWNSVTDEMRRVSATLADEMALTNLEMHLGASRTVAMRHMVDRTGVEDLGSLVAVLVQAERFGTSVADALKSFAGSMREIRSQRAQEHAEKMAVKLLFPMVLFIFPVMFIVVGGPAVMKLMEIIGN
jgi:tight adherence protein C